MLAGVEELATEAVEPASLADHEMAVQAFRDALSAGPCGYVDDCLAELRPYGFELAAVLAPTRLLLARDDGTVPAAHADWLVHQLPEARLQWVDGGHFGPRDEPAEELLAWVAGSG